MQIVKFFLRCFAQGGGNYFSFPYANSVCSICNVSLKNLNTNRGRKMISGFNSQETS